MSKFGHRVWETTTTEGTGTVTLLGAQNGYQSFVAGVGNGKAVVYTLIHRNLPEWEVGLGVITDASSDTLSRVTVLASSNSGSLVDFSEGLKDAIVSIGAEYAANTARSLLKVKCATTANITLSGTQTIDGVSAGVGDHVLVKNQSTASQNGIYVCASGSWVRRYDLYTGDNAAGVCVVVDQGTVNADTLWLCTSNTGADVVGTDAIAFQQIGGTGTTHDAADITYTPAVLTDWNSDADPGGVDDALDQLAERVDDLESTGTDNNLQRRDGTGGKTQDCPGWSCSDAGKLTGRSSVMAQASYDDGDISAGAITIDLNAANRHVIEFGSAIDIDLTNATVGQIIQVRLKPTGSYSVTWFPDHNVYWPGGATAGDNEPAQTATNGRSDVFGFEVINIDGYGVADIYCFSHGLDFVAV